MCSDLAKETGVLDDPSDMDRRINGEASMDDSTKIFVAFTDGQLAMLLMMLKRLGTYEELSDSKKEAIAVVQRAALEALKWAMESRESQS